MKISNHKQIPFIVALLPVMILLSTGALSVFIWKVGMIIPLFSGIVSTAVISLIYGFSWAELEVGIKDGIYKALQPILILTIVGSIIGTWISSGTIPALIYYGLKFLRPEIFVPLAAVITAIVSTSTGTSFTSIATVGVALMAVGNGMGFPAPLTAAAIISGAFFGDKLSPLSDTTNIAPAMAECNLFEHVGHMLWDTIPAFIISIILYWSVSLNHITKGAEGIQQVNTLLSGLENSFNLNPLLLLLPVITILLAIRKVPAIPALFSVSVLGGIFSLLFQGTGLKQVMSNFTFGFKSSSGIQMLDNLLSKGGINSMGGTIILLITATALGGIKQKSGILDSLLKRIMSYITNSKQLTVASLLTSFLVGFSTGAQSLAIIIPANMFVSTFKKMGLHTKNLSRAVEAAGTVGVTLVPWSVPCFFAASMLGAKPVEFIPFLFFPMLVLAFNLFFALTGITIVKVEKGNQTEEMMIS